MFQSFSETADPAKGAERAAALRAKLKELSLDGFVVPRSDEHQGEYVPKSAERLAWLTGFTGSAGTAVVLQNSAGLGVEGTFTVPAAEKVGNSVSTPVQLAEPPAEEWIATHLPAGTTLAYDPWLHTQDGLRRLEQAVARAG